jgi:hypothetical protein
MYFKYIHVPDGVICFFFFLSKKMWQLSKYVFNSYFLSAVLVCWTGLVLKRNLTIRRGNVFGNGVLFVTSSFCRRNVTMKHVAALETSCQHVVQRSTVSKHVAQHWKIKNKNFADMFLCCDMFHRKIVALG